MSPECRFGCRSTDSPGVAAPIISPALLDVASQGVFKVHRRLGNASVFRMSRHHAPRLGKRGEELAGVKKKRLRSFERKHYRKRRGRRKGVMPSHIRLAHLRSCRIRCRIRYGRAIEGVSRLSTRLHIDLRNSRPVEVDAIDARPARSSEITFEAAPIVSLARRARKEGDTMPFEAA